MAEKRKNKKKVKKKRIFSAINILSFILLLIIYFSFFIKAEFNDMGFEQLIFALTNSEGSNYEIVYKGIFWISLLLILTYLAIWGLKKLYYFMKIKVTVKFGVADKVFKFEVFKVTKWRTIIFYTLFIILTLFGSIKLLALDKYYVAQTNYSSIFEEEYVAPSDVELSFPEKKRNLIYIFAESMEASSVSIDNGGLVETAYTPNLEKLAMRNVNFSENDKIGGAMQLNNTGWTVAALVAHTTGIPFKVPIDGNGYKGDNGFMPGVESLGDILQENGYKNYFMLGSDASISGRKNYFEQHGDYEILDYLWAQDEEKISKDYYEWWGFEDAKLFDYAKEKLLEIADDEEPFNFTMLTADTHFTDGYMDKSCKKKFGIAYADAFYCSDSKLGDFVKWVQEQDFYENTTIVIVGDHLTMQSNFYDTNDNSARRIFNLFINSAVKTKYDKNRLFSTLDYFPTTLASLGVSIEGDRLGLGVNLFSGEETLVEKMGFEALDEELSIKSFYYDKKFLGDSYYEMMNGKD